ncbi:hypothetical protein PHMEG_0005169 [Phytophthora megakarya]|uniref:ZSWIM1/3 RNaseH-like domain-containing protein n=1 Tax=Phytophthora megakarya TaxID=4795 RepID=A0A225WRY4_9STRA|nr:hypothetical protein PHMEG_0005169 [Phytophthora megakarya]
MKNKHKADATKCVKTTVTDPTATDVTVKSPKATATDTADKGLKAKDLMVSVVLQIATRADTQREPPLVDYIRAANRVIRDDNGDDYDHGEDSDDGDDEELAPPGDVNKDATRINTSSSAPSNTTSNALGDTRRNISSDTRNNASSNVLKKMLADRLKRSRATLGVPQDDGEHHLWRRQSTNVKTQQKLPTSTYLSTRSLGWPKSYEYKYSDELFSPMGRYVGYGLNTRHEKPRVSFGFAASLISLQPDNIVGCDVVTPATERGFRVINFLALDQKAITMEIISSFFNTKNTSLGQIETVVIDKDFMEWRVFEKGFPTAKTILCQFHAVTYWRKV